MSVDMTVTRTESVGPQSKWMRRRPLVIVGVGGGLVQWDVCKPGVGLPRLHVLDYDREGADEDEIKGLIEEITAAQDDLAEYHDAEDLRTLTNLGESVVKYQQMIEDGESPGRYR
jgi:hypothetical protein